MSTINANIADYLTQIERLTNTNLQILKSLNDSFFTKKNHIYAEVDETTYVIPSFLSLENKINSLQENFENLVKSPETSEAYFNFDGNTRAIEVRKYSHVPNGITLPVVSKYGVESNDIFKDFMTPVPYINLDLPETMPNDIVEVNVKKIVPKTDSLKALFSNKLSYQIENKDDKGNVVSIDTRYHTSVNEKYGDIYKLLSNYREDYDYIEYDTIYKLPVRKNIGTATYVIESVVSDIIDDDLNEIITLKLRNNLKDLSLNNKLTYRLFDDTIEKSLQVGDELINYDGTGKVVITEVRPSTNTIKVKVVNGEYLNFLGTDSYDTDNDKDIHDLSKIRFHAAVDFNTNKYVKVPLEEDQYVFVAVAPVNSRMNLQASWGVGIIINTYSLMNSSETTSFKTYYDANVKNIGDVLYEMTSMVTSPLTSLSEDTFKKISSTKPTIDLSVLKVMHINKHLNNSETVKNIRYAYQQKKKAESDLNVIQEQISSINNQLSSLTFNDSQGMYSLYSSQLATLNSKRNELLKALNTAITSISNEANSSDIPIENAKYRIRGFYIPNVGTVNGINLNDHVVGIKVQYRYKTASTATGSAVTMNGYNGETYIYSDWNTLSTKNKEKHALCTDGIYNYSYEINNENVNEPSYNQIDIPISQGENVDIRLKVVYDYGQPYITVSSDWSDIVNIKFPEEFEKNVSILSIIEENNNDIETNRFNNILNDTGVNTHINDMVIDQSTTYFHKPDNIASGFYTAERRIIPLKDKLISLSNDIAELKNEIINSADNLSLSLSIGNSSTTLLSNSDNNIILEAYNTVKISNTNTDALYNGDYIYENGIVSVVMNLMLTNNGTNSIKLYPIFPGNKDESINSSATSYVDKNDYCYENDGGVLFKYQNGDKDVLQKQHQFITFRINDPWTKKAFYSTKASQSTDNMQNIKSIQTLTNDSMGMVVYPYLSTLDGLSINTTESKSYKTLNSGESIIIPIMCSYVVPNANTSIKKTISFDIRTSLYTNPINYTFTVIGKNTTSVQDKLTIINKKRLWDYILNPKYVIKLR